MQDIAYRAVLGLNLIAPPENHEIILLVNGESKFEGMLTADTGDSWWNPMYNYTAEFSFVLPTDEEVHTMEFIIGNPGNIAAAGMRINVFPEMFLFLPN